MTSLCLGLISHVRHASYTLEASFQTHKKSNSICHHAVRESVAMGESLTAHVSTDKNKADICTKVLPGRHKRNNAVGMILHDMTNIRWGTW